MESQLGGPASCLWMPGPPRHLVNVKELKEKKKMQLVGGGSETVGRGISQTSRCRVCLGLAACSVQECQPGLGGSERKSLSSLHICVVG